MKRSTRGVALLVGVTMMAGTADAQQDRKRLLWWNDPLIVDELTLSRAQRRKMDRAYQDFRRTAEPLRRQPTTQKPYLEALETGNWRAAKSESKKWLDAEQTPKRAMIDLKLEILPMLSADQRARLLEKYPRLIRRNWRPNPRWGRPARGGERARKEPGSEPPSEKDE